MTIKDQFTLDGRLKPANHLVTRKKVAEADRLLKQAFQGDHIAAGQLAEVHSSSDLKFNMAHLITAVALPQFDAAERSWSEVADVRTVPDFGPVRLTTLYGQMTGAGVAEGPKDGNGDAVAGITGGLPVVPELSPYPYVTISGQEAFYAKLRKLGAKFGFSWEANLQDIVGFFEQIPGELVNLALDAEEREVYEALINGTTNPLASQTLPDGTTTLPNAPLSPEAIWAAILQLQNVTVQGRKVGRASGYNVIIPIGTRDFIEWKMNQRVIAIQDGLIMMDGGDRSVLNSVSFVESAYVTGDNWYVIPKKGSIRRPVLELLRLRGYEQPELRVHGDTGSYVGGSAVSPFEGNFDADAIDYRIRYVAGGVLWDAAYTLKSDGSGS